MSMLESLLKSLHSGSTEGKPRWMTHFRDVSPSRSQVHIPSDFSHLAFQNGVFSELSSVLAFFFFPFLFSYQPPTPKKQSDDLSRRTF